MKSKGKRVAGTGLRNRRKLVLFFCAGNRSSRMSGISAYCEAAKLDVRTFDYGNNLAKTPLHCNSMRLDVKSLLKLWNPDGIIIECAGLDPALPFWKSCGLPVVLLDCHPQRVSYNGMMMSVCTDDRGIARMAAGELCKLGISHYAYVPWHDDTAWSKCREAAFADAISELGGDLHRLTLGKNRICTGAEFKTIADKLLRLPRPCGIFAANDLLARIVVKACDIAGLSVPQDMAVVGVDNNLHFCENESISISSITLNSFGMGYRAAELIDRCIHGKGRNGQIVAVGGNELLRRASTRRFQKADARVTRAVEYIRKSACDGITPADVVREMGCSRRLADLRFREVVEHSILDEIHSVKIDRVKSLLRDSCRQCAALPDMCGYSSLADLCRDFKRRTGKTLREWRKDNEQGIAVIAKL